MKPTATFLDEMSFPIRAMIAAPQLDGISVPAVAAAMVAVVAEHEPGYAAETNLLHDAKGRGCIQGAMLAKLGYPFKSGCAYGGGTFDVVQMLGRVRVGDLERLEEALLVAQHANDLGLPWSAALEGFERCLAGEERLHLYCVIEDARDGLHLLRRSSARCSCCLTPVMDQAWMQQASPSIDWVELDAALTKELDLAFAPA